jgi:co-chaperonin GroES (HSP10)
MNKYDPLNPNDKLYGSQENPSGITPCGYKLLVELCESQEVAKYKDTLVLPESVAERYDNASIVAKVLQVGSGCYNSERFPEGPWCFPGQYVVLSPYAGTRIRSSLIPGSLRLINEDTIDAVVPYLDLVERG